MKKMESMEIAWGVAAAVCALAIGTGVSVLGFSPPLYDFARSCFVIAAVILAATTFLWALKTQQPIWWRLLAGTLVWLFVGLGLPETLRWIKSRQSTGIQLTTASAVQAFSGSVKTVQAPIPAPLQSMTGGRNTKHEHTEDTVDKRRAKSVDYASLSNAELALEINRFCTSVSVIAARQQADMDDISQAMRRVEEGKVRSDDPPMAALRTTWYEKSDVFTGEVRTKYYPALSALRVEALRRLGAATGEDPDEKRLWEAMVSYLESPPMPVSAVHLRDCARYIQRMGEKVAAL